MAEEQARDELGTPGDREWREETERPVPDQPGIEQPTGSGGLQRAQRTGSDELVDEKRPEAADDVREHLGDLPPSERS